MRLGRQRGHSIGRRPQSTKVAQRGLVSAEHLHDGTRGADDGCARGGAWPIMEMVGGVRATKKSVSLQGFSTASM